MSGAVPLLRWAIMRLGGSEQRKQEVSTNAPTED